MSPPATVIRADGRPGGSPDDRNDGRVRPETGPIRRHPSPAVRGLPGPLPVVAEPRRDRFARRRPAAGRAGRDRRRSRPSCSASCSATAGVRRWSSLPCCIGLLMYGHAANLLGTIHVPGIVQQAGWVGARGHRRRRGDPPERPPAGDRRHRARPRRGHPRGRHARPDRPVPGQRRGPRRRRPSSSPSPTRRPPRSATSTG